MGDLSAQHDAHAGPMIGPVIGITSDIADGRYRVGRAYARAISEAGGTPVLLPCEVDALDAYLALCDGFVLTGGDDPEMTAWGEAMHPRATAIHPERQQFEVALLRELKTRPGTAVLGICLGMQLMGLEAGGTLDQHLPDTLPTWRDHWESQSHAVAGALGSGTVCSHHRQAIVDPGTLTVVATAPDGVIEAVRDESRTFWLGVQWHAERTADPMLGCAVFQAVVDAAACGAMLSA